MEKERLLILYTNRLFAEGLASLLKREAGIEVVGIEECGESALDFVRLLEPDVIIIDSKDRVPCSKTIIPRIMQERPKVRVVFLSMSDNNIDVYQKHRIAATRSMDLVEAIQMA